MLNDPLKAVRACLYKHTMRFKFEAAALASFDIVILDTHSIGSAASVVYPQAARFE